MKAQSVRAAAEIALQVPSGANGVRLSVSMKNRPTTPMTARHELQDGRDDLDGAGLTRARDVYEREQPDDRDADERGEQVVRAQVAPEDGEVPDEGDRDRRVPAQAAIQ